jgi:hypothetical protein
MKRVLGVLGGIKIALDDTEIFSLHFSKESNEDEICVIFFQFFFVHLFRFSAVAN